MKAGISITTHTPVSARHGLKWYEIDFNWYGIWLMKKLGLASDVHCANAFESQTRNKVPVEPKNHLASA